MNTPVLDSFWTIFSAKHELKNAPGQRRWGNFNYKNTAVDTQLDKIKAAIKELK